MTGYTKLFSSILDSTVWQTPGHVRLVWITMLAMADRHGVVEASVPGLALRAGVSRPECEQALAILSSPDPDSRSENDEGRRIVKVDGGWHLINHGKYRHRMSDDERRERDAARKRAKRAAASAASAECPRTSAGVRDVAHAEAEAEAKAERETGPRAAVPGITGIGEVVRLAVVAHHETRRVPPPSETRTLTHPHWSTIARWLWDAAKLRRWPAESLPDRARALVAAFYSSRDERTVKARHPIAYLAKDPAQYVGIEVPR